MNKANNRPLEIWRVSPVLWGVFAFGIIVLGLLYYDGLKVMVEWWLEREEYSHGILIPFIATFLVWQKKDHLELVRFDGSWIGVAIVIFGVSLFYLGELSGIYTVLQYTFLLALYGMILSLTGVTAFRVILVPLAILIFMLPLPNYLYNDLSNRMQLVSTEIGVWFIRLFDISVYQEGNVIDLGVLKLQVVDACSGLRYLFPLMTLGFIAAYIFTGAFWKKVVIFISSVPITVLMNSIRIGLIGVSVEYWGKEMAEGILHDFEGWVMFMSCVGTLIAEMWILASIGRHRLPLRQAFGLDLPEPAIENAKVLPRQVPKTLVVSAAIASIVLASSFVIKNRQDLIPERRSYAEFPLVLGNWKGQSDTLEQIYIDKLKLTDYMLIDYHKNDDIPVNLYSAYYASQRKDSTTHSPRACLPGGGWEILEMKKKEIPGIKISAQPLIVNRGIIRKNDEKQLVYYWFQQRGRIITNEEMVKWYFFIDSIQMHRTDGALMRLTTPMTPGDSIEKADERLIDILREISPILTQYVPN